MFSVYIFENNYKSIQNHWNWVTISAVIVVQLQLVKIAFINWNKAEKINIRRKTYTIQIFELILK